MKEEFEKFWESNSPYSNWYMSPFEAEGITFNCSEQYYMYKKALFFNDQKNAELILEEKTPRRQKKLGKDVANFNTELWDKHSFQIMYDVCKAKFTYDKELLEAFLATKPKIFQECSPYDKKWGSGLLKTDPRSDDRNQWLGDNMLGEVLTKLRDDLLVEKLIIS